MMDYKLIVFDIDGTLVNSNHELTEYTRDVLLKLKENGILIGLASGRSIDQLTRLAESWDVPFDVFIGINGARLYDGINDECYSFFELKKEWVREIIEFMAPFNLNCHAYHETYTIYLKNDERTELARKKSARKIIVANSIEDMCVENVPKIMFRTGIDNSREIELYAMKHCRDEYKVVRTQNNVLEFVAKDCSKSFALQIFCENNNISMEQVVAFGDTSNDNELLKIAGLGVCLVNGSEDTKQVADAITLRTNEDDGVADYIEKYIFS